MCCHEPASYQDRKHETDATLARARTLLRIEEQPDGRFLEI